MGNSNSNARSPNKKQQERSVGTDESSGENKNPNRRRVRTVSFANGEYGGDEMMGPILRRKKVVSLSTADRAFFTINEVDRSATDDGRQRQISATQKLLRRKQVSRDMYSAQDVDFFVVPEDDEEEVQNTEEAEFRNSLFFPLRFPPPMKAKAGGHGGHGGHGHGGGHGVDLFNDDGEIQALPEDKITRATRSDYIKTGILFVLMAAFVGVCIGWKTHEDKNNSIFGYVGRSCVTPCVGDVTYRDFFTAHHNHFGSGDVISLVARIDPKPNKEYDSSEAIVEIARIDTDSFGQEIQTVVHTETFGPPDSYKRERHTAKVTVDWDDPDKHHVINISSSSGYPISLTLAAMRLTPMTQRSVLIAALIMVFVYLFILLEWIHRTLVAIFGSMIALFFYFLMHGGETESIKTVMLHQEWSTLGLLFGMMLLVGELSETGIFEWLSVRILVSARGSFRRLLILLCLLTAVASAFLDNVTTMLLLAPVTIDMCNILQVDPRPYLISEVILSNIGGAATLIGDPPNIIIGSSFDEVGFVDFIVNVMPCIFIVATPVSLVLMAWLYNPYMTYKEMPALDIEKLKGAYPIYNEPKLWIAGTTTSFVILLFFLHPFHHKDTAWIALIGAFLTIAFTNPHDVQDALRNHVEWDTLLFFGGLFVLVEVCAAMGLLETIGFALADVIARQDESQQLPIAITLILWVSAVTSAFLDNIPYTATMIPVVRILHATLPDTLPLKTIIWALSFGACLGGNGTLLGASANIVTAGIASGKGLNITFLNFFYPGMVAMIATTAIANLYMLIVYVWV